MLGPLLVERDHHPLALGGPKQRVVLTMLLMDPGRTVSVGRLVDGVWGEEPPEGAVNTLHAHVSNLRKAIGGRDSPIVTQPPGYLIEVTRGQLDLLRLDELTQAGHRSARAGHKAKALGLLDEALRLWRGRALEDLGQCPFAQTARAFLEERRLGVVDDRLGLMIELGRYRQVIEDCEDAAVP